MTADAARAPAAVDHLVVVAHDLDQGVRWCRRTLGLEPGPGGRHGWMGTHNRLLPIGSAVFPQAYLEIIAIDPQAPAPSSPRWFDMDDPAARERAARAPELRHWVARVADFDGCARALAGAGHDPGPAHAGERATPAGLLRWRITVPTDGRPRCGGALPALIDWAGAHPTEAMPVPTLVLTSLRLRGVPAGLQSVLAADGVSYAGDGGSAIEAELQTPLGRVRLAGPRPAAG